MLKDVASSVFGGGDFTLSATGTFVYMARKGQRRKLGPSRGWTAPARYSRCIPSPARTSRHVLSPDGKRLAFSTRGTRGFDLWVKDLDRDIPSRLSFLKGENEWPVWTPMGRASSSSHGTPTIGAVLGSLRRCGRGSRLTDGELEDETPYSITPDGKRLAFTARGNGKSPDLFTTQSRAIPPLEARQAGVVRGYSFF